MTVSRTPKKPSVRPVRRRRRLELAVLMDPIAKIKPYKDSTFAMLLEAQRRGHAASLIQAGDLSLSQGRALARVRPVSVRDDRHDWFTLGEPEWTELARFDAVLARKDPPVDADFLADTWVLDAAVNNGVPVFNRPASLRDANEKLFALHFPELCPPTLVARDAARLVAFVDEVGQAVLKPIDGMAGKSIFKTHAGDPNLNVILETLTADGRSFALAQKFVPEVSAGDKRILLIDGRPVPYCLARIPQGTDFRGNLARGGKGVAQPLSKRDRAIAAAVGPELRRRGLMFVGLDVIGDWLTEINVTSPTGIREIDAQCGTNIAGELFDAIEKSLRR